MSTYLVTGGAGFIGSAFVKYILKTYPDSNVVVYDAMTYSGNVYNLLGVNKCRYRFVRGNIQDYDLLCLTLSVKHFDYVVNFAAETHVDRSIMGASDFIKTNVNGVNTLLKASLDNKVGKVLLVSTDEVYGSTDGRPFTELDPMHPRNPYAASKAAGELFGVAYFETYGLPVITTRGTNTYGPNQYPEKILPLFVTNAIENKPLPLYGDGKHVRDWLYVDDHCSGIDCALHNGVPGEVYNIAGENEKENIELTMKILKLTGKDSTLIKPVTDREGHDRRYSIDATKLKQLGWAPKMNWSKGVEKSVKWYQDNEWWWKPIKSGEFKEYYEKQYGSRLK